MPDDERTGALSRLLSLFTGEAPLNALGAEYSKSATDRRAEPDFPSVAEARKYKDLIGYGNNLDYYMTNNQARMADADVRHANDYDIVMASQRAKPEWSTRGAEQLAQAKLAMSKNPIAALGFDPDQIAMNPRNDWSPLMGAYYPIPDQEWVSGYDPATIVHESMHRGLQKLRNGGAAVLEGWPGTEEDFVRYVMESRYGTESPGNPDAVARGYAAARMKPDVTSRVIGMLETAAQEAIARQNPRGPR